MDARRVVPGEHHRLGDFCRHERIGGRRCRRTRHRRNRGDEKGRLRCRDGGRDHRGVGDDRPHHSAIAADDRLRCRGGNIGGRVVHCRRDTRPVDGGGVDGDGAKPVDPAEHAASSIRRLARAVAVLLRAFWAILAPFLLIGGMLSGVFTPTEAASVAVVYALVLGLYVYREFTWRDLPKLILDTVETTGVVMALVMTATLLGYCLTVARIPQEFGGWLTALSTNPLVYMLIVNVLLLVVGCFMEDLAAMLVLIPIHVHTAL